MNCFKGDTPIAHPAVIPVLYNAMPISQEFRADIVVEGQAPAMSDQLLANRKSDPSPPYALIRASVAVVECPGSRSASATLPPQPRTRSAPTTLSSV